jgi:hypothetical protein
MQVAPSHQLMHLSPLGTGWRSSFGAVRDDGCADAIRQR